MKWLAQRFELSRGGEAQNVRPMEGLRGFAVFLVFLVHYASLVDPWVADTPGVVAFNRALLTIGFTGVDLFFVLSGFLIYGSLIGRRQSFLRFIGRRLERLYPAFTAVFALYVVLSFVFPKESKIPADGAAAAIYLVQNYLMLPGLFDIRPMITVAWSLSYEMFYYLTLPLVIGALGLRERRASWRVGFFVALALAYTVYCARFGGSVELVMFVSGILLHEAMASPRTPSPGSAIGFAALVAGLLWTLVPPPGAAGIAMKSAGLFVAFFVTCLACFRDPASAIARAFSWTPLRWLGNMSYSYYLLHGLALKGAFIFFSMILPPASGFDAWIFWALLPPMFLLTLVPTGALFLMVERPYSLLPATMGRSGGSRIPGDAVAGNSARSGE